MNKSNSGIDIDTLAEMDLMSQRVNLMSEMPYAELDKIDSALKE